MGLQLLVKNIDARISRNRGHCYLFSKEESNFTQGNKISLGYRN